MTAAGSHQHRHDIDWLRVIAVLFLIPFHTARVFDIWEPFYVKSPDTSEALSYGVIATISPWQMPLLFLLAGAATWYALGFRSSRQYMWERVKRLFVPLIFGLLVIVPPMGYYARLDQGNQPASIGQFYKSYFTTDPGDLTGYTGNWTPGHLWFIMYLFFFSALALPLFLWLKRGGGRRIISSVATAAGRPGIILLPAVILGMVGFLTGGSGGVNPFYYIVLFIAGFFLFADARFEDAINSHRWPALILGAVTMAVVEIGRSGRDLGLPDLAWALIVSLNTWLFLIVLLAFGKKLLTKSSRMLVYANQAAYPFYILHQTVIVVIAYYFVGWDLPLMLRFVLIAVFSFGVSITSYDIFARRLGITRFLFGMKPAAGN